jgi:hypothetical protein
MAPRACRQRRIHGCPREGRIVLDLPGGELPVVAVVAGRIRVPVVLDGEILGAGRPDFGLLQSRIDVRHPSAPLVEAISVQLHVFDLLYRGRDSLACPIPRGGPGRRISAWTTHPYQPQMTRDRCDGLDGT